MTGLMCEQCGAAAGNVYDVAMHPRQVLLLVRCENCQHCWKVDGDAPPEPRFKRKRDRRSAHGSFPAHR